MADNNQLTTQKATAKRQQNAVIRQKYKEFLPKGVDPTKVYLQWAKSIFGSQEVDDSLMYFVLSQANAAGIDPRVPRQIYAIGYKNNKTGGTDWQVIIGIEGLVTIAENTKMYGGTTKPEYDFDDQGRPLSCTIGVHKVVQGVPITSYQTVYFDEYNAPEKGGKPTLWKSKPMTMLKKVALAHALRATFSACAGLYVEEEVQRADVINAGTLPVTADIRERISKIEDSKQAMALLNELNPEQKQQAAPLINERIDELRAARKAG